MAKQDKPFNNPFSAVKLKKDEPAKPAPARPKPARYDPPKGKASSEDEERAMFLQSVGEVEPVRAPRAGPPAPKPPPGRGSADEEEALLQLAELVAGDGAAFDLAGAEGAVAGLDPQLLRKLRRGDYPVQAQLDLAGLARAEAREQLEVFVRTAQSRHFRCVRVVNAGDLQAWLVRGRLARQVLAFAAAQAPDAVDVLLRR